MKTSKLLRSIKTMPLKPGTVLVVSGDDIGEHEVALIRGVFEKLLAKQGLDYKVPVLGVSEDVRFEVISIPVAPK